MWSGSKFCGLSGGKKKGWERKEKNVPLSSLVLLKAHGKVNNHFIAHMSSHVFLNIWNATNIASGKQWETLYSAQLQSTNLVSKVSVGHLSQTLGASYLQARRSESIFPFSVWIPPIQTRTKIKDLKHKRSTLLLPIYNILFSAHLCDSLF